MSSLRPIPPGAGSTEEALDREALGRLVAGDLEALQGLYDRHATMAYSIALRITADPSLAEDVVQETFLGVWRSAGRYLDERGSIRTWLLSIARHRAIDLVRRRRQTSELPDPEGSVPDALVLPDVWPDVAGRMDREAVRVALEAIPTAQRQAIELAYFGGLTQQDIAERTGVALGTVKSRMRLGLMGLRDALAGPRATLPRLTGERVVIGGRGGNDA